MVAPDDAAVAERDLDSRAVAILRGNDRGGHTIPGKGLYPHQWNWDSAFAALGIVTFDAERAWVELETLLAAQWPNGMVPHIVFRKDDPGYFPGPDVWDTPATPPTSGYSQPPILATVLRRLVELDRRDEHRDRLRRLFTKVLGWHRWFHGARDPDGLGVIAVAHPWESGRDNSPDWDAPMVAVDTTGIGDYQRRDLQHVDADMRPQKADYDRYLALVKFGREHGWRDDEIARNGPFWAADVGMTMILLRADRDLRWLAERLGEAAAARELDDWIGRAEQGVERLWNPAVEAYCARDLRTGAAADGVTSVSFLACYAGLGKGPRAEQLITHLRRILGLVRFAVPSFDHEHAKFNPLRYWRGPSWPVINYLVGTGLREAGYEDLAVRLREDTRALIETAGFHEYYCPLTGRGCGGADFSWTAAIWLIWASPSRSSLAA